MGASGPEIADVIRLWSQTQLLVSIERLMLDSRPM